MRIAATARDGVLEILLDGPPGNILDRAACAEIAGALRDRGSDPALRAILLRSAGKHFSFGASVPEHTAAEVAKFLPGFHALFRTLLESGVPTVAAVRGLCLGGGCELALACDFVVAEESASFGVPEIQLGVFPPVACLLLPWRAGGGAALDWILTGRRVPAPEAARAGLVTRLCPDGGLDAAVGALLAGELGPLSGSSLRIAGRAARAPLLRAVREELPRLEALYLNELMATKDANEGIQAFLEKRKPAWRHA